MGETKNKENNIPDIKKIDSDQEEKVSGGSKSNCPICHVPIDDEYMDAHIRNSHPDRSGLLND